MHELPIPGKVIKKHNPLGYLGIVFDRSLSGINHISLFVSKARKDLTSLNVIAFMNMPHTPGPGGDLHAFRAQS